MDGQIGQVGLIDRQIGCNGWVSDLLGADGSRMRSCRGLSRT